MNAQAVEERPKFIQLGQLRWGCRDSDGGEKALAFEAAAEHAGEQVLEHYAFVEGVLVDDEHAVFVLSKQETLVDLEHARRWLRARGMVCDPRSRNRR